MNNIQQSKPQICRWKYLIQKKKMDSKKIIDALQKGVVTIVFKKIDTGEIRTMPCTL